MRTSRNAAFGWTWMAVGVGMGLVLGLFAFDGPFAPPCGLEDPSVLPRRLLRLSHIAFVALGFINVLAEREPDGPASRRGRALLLAGSAFLPPLLGAGAFLPAARIAFGVPAVLVMAGLVLLAGGRRRGKELSP